MFELLNQRHLAFSSSARDASHCETIYWLSKDVSKNLSGEGGEGGPNFDGKSKEFFFTIFTRQVTGTHVFARILM